MRILLLLLAIWIAVTLVHRALRRRTRRPTRLTTTVQCARCGIHLPTEQALQHVDGRHYCSIEHARGES